MDRLGVLKRGLGEGLERVNCSYVPPHTNHPPRDVETPLAASRTPETVGVASNLMDCTDTYGQIATNSPRRPTPLITIPLGLLQ